MKIVDNDKNITEEKLTEALAEIFTKIHSDHLKFAEDTMKSISEAFKKGIEVGKRINNNETN